MQMSTFFLWGRGNQQHQYFVARKSYSKSMFPCVLNFTFWPLTQKLIFLNSDNNTVCSLFVFHLDLRLDGEKHSGLPQFSFSLSWAPAKCCSLSHLLNLDLIILEWKITLLPLTSPNIFSCELIKSFWFYFIFLLVLLFDFTSHKPIQTPNSETFRHLLWITPSVLQRGTLLGTVAKFIILQKSEVAYEDFGFRLIWFILFLEAVLSMLDFPVERPHGLFLYVCVCIVNCAFFNC